VKTWGYKVNYAIIFTVSGLHYIYNMSITYCMGNMPAISRPLCMWKGRPHSPAPWRGKETCTQAQQTKEKGPAWCRGRLHLGLPPGPGPIVASWIRMMMYKRAILVNKERADPWQGTNEQSYSIRKGLILDKVQTNKSQSKWKELILDKV